MSTKDLSSSSTEPAESGVDGTQEPLEVTAIPVEPEKERGSISEHPLAAELQRSISAGVPAGAAMGFLFGWTQQTTSDAVSTRVELERYRDRYDATSKENAVLKERLRASTSTRRLQTIMITIGATLLGASVSLFQAQLSGYGVAAIGIGVVLLIGGWWPTARGEA